MACWFIICTSCVIMMQVKPYLSIGNGGHRKKEYEFQTSIKISCISYSLYLFLSTYYYLCPSLNTLVFDLITREYCGSKF